MKIRVIIARDPSDDDVCILGTASSFDEERSLESVRAEAERDFFNVDPVEDRGVRLWHFTTKGSRVVDLDIPRHLLPSLSASEQDETIKFKEVTE